MVPPFGYATTFTDVVRSNDDVGSGFRTPPPRSNANATAITRTADRYFELKSQIHRKLIGVLNLERASSIPKDRMRAEIGRVVERLLDEERVPMTTAEQARIVEEVLDEVLEFLRHGIERLGQFANLCAAV